MYTVDTALDVVANDNMTSLREAVDAANGQAAGVQHVITFAPGLTGQTISLNSQLALEKNIYLAGPGANTLTVQRNAAMGNFRLFEVKATSDSIIAGLKLRGGNPQGGDGGAILDGGRLTVTGCIIRDSNASRGGGIATTAKLLPGTPAQESQLTIYDTVVTNNTAAYGGGVAVIDCDMVAQYGVEVSWNSAVFGGGGVYVETVIPGLVPFVTLNGVFISGNTTEFNGGGIYCGEGRITLVGGSITYNTAAAPGRETQGGGVFVSDKGIISATNSPTIGHNNATQGDGMYIKAGGQKTGTIIYDDDTEYDANPA